jgi:hypothetical protein
MEGGESIAKVHSVNNALADPSYAVNFFAMGSAKPAYGTVAACTTYCADAKSQKCAHVSEGHHHAHQTWHHFQTASTASYEAKATLMSSRCKACPHQGCHDTTLLV